MARKILVIVAAFLFIGSNLILAQEGQSFNARQKAKIQAFREEQKKEDVKFRQSIKDKLPAEKTAATIEHQNAQYASRKAFNHKIHEENMAYLRDGLVKNSKLTDAQKTEEIDFMEQQYRESVAFHDKQHSENIAFFRKVENDPRMTPGEKEKTLKAHFAAQKEAAKKFFQAQQEQKKSEMK